MRTTSRGRLISVLLAIVCLAAAQIACSLFTGQPAAPPPEQVEIEEPDDQEQNQSGQSSDPLDDQSAGPVEPQFGEDSLDCPAKGASLMLGFDHALTVNYQDTSITHFLHQGYLPLRISDDTGTIVSEGPVTLTYSMEGMMSDECTLTGEGEMHPDAHGTCEAGVVNLIIKENWGPLNGKMVCIDNDGDVIEAPFNVPAMGMQTHSGQNGQGEIFYLVEGSEGYSSMRPFAEGEGYHTWTLYTEDIPLVPLVP